MDDDSEQHSSSYESAQALPHAQACENIRRRQCREGRWTAALAKVTECGAEQDVSVLVDSAWRSGPGAWPRSQATWQQHWWWVARAGRGVTLWEQVRKGGRAKSN